MKKYFSKAINTLTLLAISAVGLAQSGAQTAMDTAELPADRSTSFWILVVIGLCLFVGILVYGFAISAIARSGMLSEAFKNTTKTGAVIALLLLPEWASATGINLHILSDLGDKEALMLIVLDSVLLVIFLYMRRILKNLIAANEVEDGIAEIETASVDIQQVLTKAVPIEREEEILMDHEYDGIRELDNSLPPWWLWGFYISIAFSFVYLFHYHVFKTGDLTIEVLAQDMEQAEIEQAEYLATMAMNIDETSVALLTGAEDLAAGNRIYKANCVTCHGAEGQGTVGPNFTDDYWLYGNTVNDLFKTIKYGAKRGMKAWTELNPQEMAQVASYILSLHGTDPSNPKDPEGDFLPMNGEGDLEPEEIIEEALSDSTQAMLLTPGQ